jgi:hypothetical protein
LYERCALEDELRIATNFVTVCVDNLIRSSAEQLLAEAEAAALRLRSLRPLLWWMRTPEVTADTNLWVPRWPMFTEEYDRMRREFRNDERVQRRQSANGRAFTEREQPFAEMSGAIQRFLDNPPEHSDPHRHPVLEPWRAAREALHHDCDAPLPALPV